MRRGQKRGGAYPKGGGWGKGGVGGSKTFYGSLGECVVVFGTRIGRYTLSTRRIRPYVDFICL